MWRWVKWKNCTNTCFRPFIFIDIFVNMQRTCFFIATAICLLLLASCQKELSLENNPGTPPGSTGNDSTLLSMYIQVDTTAGSIDTMSKTVFEYDVLKRLTAYKTFNYINNIPALAEPSVRGYYFYNGTDTLAFKTIIVAADSSGSGDINVDSSCSFLTRNASQQITRDSVYYLQYQRTTGPGLGTLHTYTSNFIIYADSVIDNYRETDNAGGITSVVTGKNKYAQTKLNGNLASETFYIWENTGYRQIRSESISYDNKINPLKILSTNYPVILNDNFSANEYLYRNNFTQITSTENTTAPPVTSTAVYMYTYNTLNLPKTVVSYDIANPLSAVKGIYIYTK